MLFSLHKQLFSYNWQQCCVNNMSQIPSKMQDQNKLAGKCFRVIPGLGKCLAPISNKILKCHTFEIKTWAKANFLGRRRSRKSVGYAEIEWCINPKFSNSPPLTWHNILSFLCSQVDWSSHMALGGQWWQLWYLPYGIWWLLSWL